MSEATFTFRVDEGLKAEFSNAAKANDRTGAQLLRDFMRDFVQRQQQAADHDAWFRRQVQVGLDAATAGDLVSDEEVEAEAAAWRAETRRGIVRARKSCSWFGRDWHRKIDAPSGTSSRATTPAQHWRSTSCSPKWLRASSTSPRWASRAVWREPVNWSLTAATS